MSSEQFHQSFGNAIEAEESDELFARWGIPAPGRPLFEATSEDFPRESPAEIKTDLEARGPLLLITSGHERGLGEAVTKAAHKQSPHSGARPTCWSSPTAATR